MGGGFGGPVSAAEIDYILEADYGVECPAQRQVYRKRIRILQRAFQAPQVEEGEKGK